MHRLRLSACTSSFSLTTNRALLLQPVQRTLAHVSRAALLSSSSSSTSLSSLSSPSSPLSLSPLPFLPRSSSSVRTFLTSLDPPAVSSESRVANSLKFYDRHIFVASGTPYSSWRSKLEDAPVASATASEHVYFQLAEAMKRKKFTSHNPLVELGFVSASEPAQTVCPRLTLFDISAQKKTSASFSEGDLLVLSVSEPPFHIRRSGSGNQIEIHNLATGKSLTSTQVQAFPELHRITVILDYAVVAPASSNAPASARVNPFNFMAFVCCHAKRDERCGSRGPKFIEAIEQQQQPSLQVFPCSHIGGHEFAPNMLLYGWAAQQNEAAKSHAFCDWFGLVSPSHAVKLIQQYDNFVQTASTTTSSTSLQDLRASMLATQLPPVNKSEVCAACAPPLSANPIHAAHYWRGGMAVERKEANQILSQTGVELL